MTDPTPPVPSVGAGATARLLSAADTIRTLARRHGVAYEATVLDAFAADVARLSDAEAPGDEIADVVVALKRAGVLNARQAASLYGDHLAQARG